MKPYELKLNIIRLLSNARKTDDPRHTIGMSSRQICDRLEGLVAPHQNPKASRTLMERVKEQLGILEGEFEILSKGEVRKIYRIAPPSLIAESDKPLRAKYVGDRAYFQQVLELIDAVGNMDTQFIETRKSSDEARFILENHGITVQTEEKLFEFLPTPAVPTRIDISIAEDFAIDEVSGVIEAYVPRRTDFFSNRWIRLSDALPSSMSQLRRIKDRSWQVGRFTTMYAWEADGKLYKLKKNQALLAMYRIDLDKNAARTLDLNKTMPSENAKVFKDMMPLGFDVLVSRYTESFNEDVPSRYRDDDRERRRESLRIVPRFKKLLITLLEQKLGINKPLH